MASITVRQLSAAWDPIRGHSLGDYLSDLPAVAQIIRQMLLLFVGEWYEDLTVGLPLFQEILGVASTSAGVALTLRKRILAAPFVIGLQNVNISYTSARTYNYSALVITQFGVVALTIQNGGGQSAAVTTAV